MTDPSPPPRRRRHRSSRLRRFARSLGIGRSPARTGILVAGLAIAVVALLAAGGVLGPGAGTAVGSPSPSAASPSSTQAATGSSSPSPQPTPLGSLPAIATPTPVATASQAPVGIVARRIRIDRLGIDLRIVEGDGLEAPMNKAAHYPGTGWPGGGVNIYLYAHAQTGMFLSLWDAKVGDEVLLDLADGTTRLYVVTDVPGKVPWNALQYVAATPPERLTLQTSTSYTATAPRFVVIAEPAPSQDASPSPVPSQ